MNGELPTRLLWCLAWAALSLIAWAIWYVVTKSVLKEAQVKVPGWVEWFAPMLLLGVVMESPVPNRGWLLFWGFLAAASTVGSALTVWTIGHP